MRRILFTFSCFLFCFQAFSQPARLRFEKLGIEQGLSNLSVYCLLQDRQGFIWVGTQGGLNRFDGYSFKIYNRDPEKPASLKDNFINCLLEDRTGALWAGTRQSLSRFDKTTEQFTNFSINPLDPSSQTHNHITTLVEDKNGNLWAGSKGGLNFFDVSKQQFTQVSTTQPLPRIHALALDNQGFLWIGAQGGLFRFDPAQRKLQDFSAWQARRLPPVLTLLDEEKKLWIGTDAGVFQLEKQTGKLRHFAPQAVSGNVGQISSINRDSKGRLVVATFRGVEILDEQTGIFSPILVDETPGGWYKHNRPQDILEDKDGVFWIATFFDGVYHYDPSFKKFLHYKYVPGDPYSLADYTVYGLCEDSDGRVWAGTGTGLSIKNPSSERFTRFPGEPLGVIWDIVEDKDRTIWIGAKIGLVKQERGKPPVYFRYDEKSKTPGRVQRIAQDKEGILWFGSGDGLFRHVPGSQVFEPVEFTNLPADTIIIYGLEESPEGHLWISTNNGLSRLDKNKRQFKVFVHDPRNPASLCDNNVTCVVFAKNGAMWVASYDGGLDRFNPKDETFTHYRMKDGLPDEKIWGMAEDHHGHLWLSTSRGLSRFDPETEQFRNYDVHDGLQSYEFNMGSYFNARHTGNLYFGGVNGFNVFHPDSLSDNLTPPEIIFTAFKYHQGSLEATDFQDVPGISVRKKVVLPYPAQAVVCEFAALNFRQSFKNRYAYRLEGVHENWIDLGVKREVTFANLRPGSYKLLVKASNNDGVWNETPAELEFVIRPPWWATWWAYILYAFLLGAAVWALYKFELRQRLAKQETLRLRELDDFKNRFFTNITHEFRTPLTVILGTAEQAKTEIEKLEIGKLKPELDGQPISNFQFLISKLSLIRRNGQNLLRLINQILDLAKLESNTLKLSYVQGDVLPYLRYIAESLHSLANAQNVMLRVESDQPKIMMDYDPERLLQIVHNLLSNAIKFTPSGGRVLLRANSTSNADSFLEIQVSDTGAGIHPEDLPKIFDRFFQANNLEKAKAGGTGIGLSLTKELVKAMRGEISVESEVGKGTTFTVKLPITNVAEMAGTDKKSDASSRSVGTALGEAQPAVPTDLEPRLKAIFANMPSGRLDQPTILLIEDNPDVVEYLAACLGENGGEGDTNQGERKGRPYHLEFAYNGRAGIEKALETVPDLIISDVMMPEKDGFEVCETLKNDELTSHIPIILLTAKADLESRISGLRRGADAYLSKPFHREELLVTLSNLLEVRRKLQLKYLELATQLPVSSQQLPVNIQQSPDPEDTFVLKVKTAVLERLSDSSLNVEDLCRALGMSQSQLHRKLTALTGKNASQFIRSLRLVRAKELLKTKEMNVSEVAYEVGFDDPKYFSRVFAEEFGIAPSKI